MRAAADRKGTTRTPIEPPRADELRSLLWLLEAAGLPRQGFAEHLDDALVAREHGRLLGCVELELYGEHALLRSLAVHPRARGRGLGERLVRAGLARARERGVRRVYLLTTTAESYFPRFGFEPLPREALPSALMTSEELRGGSSSVSGYDSSRNGAARSGGTGS